MSVLRMSAAERRLLPGGRLSGATPWLIAIMTFVMMLVAAAGLTVSHGAATLEDASASRYTLQLPGGAGKEEALAASIRGLPQVRSVEAVPREAVVDSLERWLGAASEGADLPIPALAEVTLTPGADAAVVEKAARTKFPTAQLSSSRSTLAPLVRSLRALGWVSLGLVLLIGLAAGAAVVLATRAALAANRSTIAVMHGVGATDAQVAALFQRRMALDALAGALVGAAAAGGLLLLLFGAGQVSERWLGGGAPIGPGALFVLALLPFAATLIAMTVARGAVIATLRRTP
ncbi:cell division protein FtsX [Sphingomicrobium nitratireducens]|uniref:cell division protein FtsX n=1 Tax=Sphingomicrobium nitratireducens TaxID=2964666 RepID=UPI00223F9568|nr:cell division protein [Sphingomicrobium nitratireducens]